MNNIIISSSILTDSQGKTTYERDDLPSQSNINKLLEKLKTINHCNKYVLTFQNDQSWIFKGILKNDPVFNCEYSVLITTPSGPFMTSGLNLVWIENRDYTNPIQVFGYQIIIVPTYDSLIDMITVLSHINNP